MTRQKRQTSDDGRDQSALNRRSRIVEWIRDHPAGVRGGELAKQFRVSRQCVVQDIAILRASGEQIMATPKGYCLPGETGRAKRAVLACRHGVDRMEEELQILVDNGVRILDVIVEHPLYGEIRGTLMIESRADVEGFVDRVKASQASLLSSLTGGVHLHTVEASRRETITRAKAQLRERGLLLR